MSLEELESVFVCENENEYEQDENQNSIESGEEENDMEEPMSILLMEPETILTTQDNDNLEESDENEDELQEEIQTSNFSDKPHSCDICSKSFARKDRLTIHYRLHTGENVFPCEYCEMVFGLAHELKMHTFVHSGERPFPCEFCQQRFKRKEHLNRHTRNVHGIKPPETTQVKKSSTINPEEKRFLCKICEFPFNRKAHLKRHIERKQADLTELILDLDDSIVEVKKVEETQLLQEKCDLCSKVFRRASDLKSHKTQVHKLISEEAVVSENHSTAKSKKNCPTKKRPWLCDYCDASFIRNDHLKRHVEKVHFKPHDPLSMDHEPSEKNYDYISKQIRPHVCDFCGKSFTRKDNLRKHEKTQHPDEFNESVKREEAPDVFLGHNMEDEECAD